MPKRLKRKHLGDISARHFRRLVNQMCSEDTRQPSSSCISQQSTSQLDTLINSTNNNANIPSSLESEGSQTAEVTYNFSLDSVCKDAALEKTTFEGTHFKETISEGNDLEDISDYETAKPDQSINKKKKIAKWAIENNITQKALTALLILLNEFFPSENFPEDARSLLKTPRNTTVKDVEPGKYTHFGILPGILDLEYRIFKFAEIKLKVGIDGLPLSDSNNSQLWPILGCVHPSSKVFLIGAYHGYSKPSDTNIFLEDFVTELITLIQNGMMYKNRKFSVTLYCIVCDAPAKSFITKTKGHTGYFSCTKCAQEGEYLRSRMCFLHKIPNFGIVTQIPVEYMHLVCIGVVKKIINMWLKSDIYSVRLQHSKIVLLSQKLISLRPFIIKEFVRKPQQIENVTKWKATELRQFLLYTSPVALHNIIPTTVYEHFLSLHVAIRILCTFNSTENFIDYAENLLVHFVESFITIYGTEFVSHNVHGLLHIVNDVRKLGSLDSYSAFVFENYMRTLKKTLRKHDKPLQQLHRRYTEKNLIDISNTENISMKREIMYKKPHSTGPVTDTAVSNQYKQINFPGWMLSVDEPNNCCIIGNIIIQIYNFAYNIDYKCMTVIGKRYLSATNIYNKPCASSLINCFLVSNLSELLETWPVSEIKWKCMKLPFMNGFAVFPLLHYHSECL